VRFDFNLGTPPRQSSRRDDEKPLRVLVMGNFAGTACDKNGTAFTPSRLDLDNFDAVMKSVNPRLELALPGLGESRVRLEFASLEDFHPDAIFRACGIFAALRDQRDRLSNPATFSSAAAGMLESGSLDRSLSTTEGEMFERLLGSRGGPAAPQVAPVTQSAVIQSLIGRLVAPHIVPDIANEQARYIASVDAAISALMRDILHAPQFQALESAWRGIRGLLDDTDGSEEVQLWLADVSSGEIAADIERAADDPAKSALFELLVARAERAADGVPWSIVVGDYLFAPGDLRALSLLGALCRRAGALLVAGADSRLVGCKSFGTNAEPARWEPDVAGEWQALRSLPFASSVALALPRVLARLPYGKQFESIDSFAFEELTGADAHEDLLWGNAAFVLGRLLIRGFLSNGWDMEPGDELELDDLPALVRGRGDDRKLQACAEIYMGERGYQKLLALGLVPVLSFEQRAAVRLARMQSIAEPPAALTARWT
jgi:type VI secretion system protein ImpC